MVLTNIRVNYYVYSLLEDKLRGNGFASTTDTKAKVALGAIGAQGC